MPFLLLMMFSDPISVERFYAGANVSFRGLHAYTQEIVWVAGREGRVVVTEDGGKSWRQVKPHGTDQLDFRDVHVVDPQTVFIQSAGSGESSRIYRTKNGGETWRQLYINPHPSGFFDGFAFWNAKHGIAYSDPVGGSFFLLETRNGGDSWRRIGTMPKAFDGEASFAGSGTGICVYPGGYVWFGTGGGGTARVFYSTDYGQTWDVSETPLRKDSPSAGVFSVLFWSPTDGCVVGGRYDRFGEGEGTAAFTTDGGKTWRKPRRAPRGYRSGMALVTVDGKKMLISVGVGGMDYTNDGGRNWLPLPDHNDLHSISFPEGSTVGWATGNKGRVARITVNSMP